MCMRNESRGKKTFYMKQFVEMQSHFFFIMITFLLSSLTFFMYLFIDQCICMCVCVCMCVYVYKSQ